MRRHGIEPASAQGITAHHSPGGEPPASNRTIPGHRFQGIGRAGGLEPARLGQHHADRVAVEMNEAQKNIGQGGQSSIESHCDHLRSLRDVSRVNPARSNKLKSCASTSPYAASPHPILAIKTSCTPDSGNAPLFRRYASRINRLERFRATAPPTRRPATKPAFRDSSGFINTNRTRRGARWDWPSS